MSGFAGWEVVSSAEAQALKTKFPNTFDGYLATALRQALAAKVDKATAFHVAGGP